LNLVSKEHASSSSSLPTLDTALAVVPPDEAWDRLQRARHVARDTSYAVWPPAIRLFHPFCAVEQLHDTALELAHTVIERYQVEPFVVTLSQWSIIPHREALEAHLQSLRELPEQQQQHPVAANNNDGTTRTPEQKVKDLIAKEERIGKEKFEQRQRRQQEIEALREDDESSNNKYEQQQSSSSKNRSSKGTTTTLPEKPTLSEDEFNGPCVICLEPDPASQEKLQAIRYLLQTELEGADAYADLYSPTSSVPLSVTPGKTSSQQQSTPNHRNHSSKHSYRFQLHP